MSELVVPMAKWRIILNMMFNPALALKQSVSKVSWQFSLGVSSLAFLLFFLQTGLDLYKTGRQSMIFAIITAGVGGLYGIIVIPILGLVVWLVLKLFKTSKDMKWTISAFCLSYSAALIYCSFGIIFSLVLGWRTSVAFGITGVIWAVGPMMTTIREMTGGKTFVSILLSTIISAIVLLSWSLIGGI